MRVLLLTAACYFAPAIALSSSWESQCDLPGKDARSERADSKEICEALCLAEKTCKAAVYVSGWNKCFLKNDRPRKATISFQSGHRDASHVEADTDFNGKDLESQVVKSAEACSQACSKRADCKSFTFISGYDVCWLKGKTTRAIPKVFSCWLKP